MNRAWLQLFRVPNLPTAAGDAVAGAALVLALRGPAPGAVAAALAAGAAELLFYMAGLADNDLVGAATDSPRDRPIPAGRLTVRAVRAARLLCVMAAAAVGAAARLPPVWWAVAAALVALIAFYNRAKDRFLFVGRFAMGACRGVALLSGAAAVSAAPFVGPPAPFPVPPLPLALAMAFLSWTIYIAAVTRLGEDEERASGPAGFSRLALFATIAFHPAFATVAFSSTAMPTAGRVAAGLCLVWVFLNVCLAVAPLVRPHGPAERRRAVGRTIGGLFWMQLGLICLFPHPAFLAFAGGCFAVRLLIRSLVPSVSGS